MDGVCCSETNQEILLKNAPSYNLELHHPCGRAAMLHLVAPAHRLLAGWPIHWLLQFVIDCHYFLINQQESLPSMGGGCERCPESLGVKGA